MDRRFAFKEVNLVLWFAKRYYLNSHILVQTGSRAFDYYFEYILNLIFVQ